LTCTEVVKVTGIITSINVKKTYQFKGSVKDDNYDACKTANMKISGRQNLAKLALTCYGGSTHERLLSESNRPYMLAYYLFLYLLLLSIGGARSSHKAYLLSSYLEEKTIIYAINAFYNLYENPQ
jgi:hypothetical protein